MADATAFWAALGPATRRAIEYIEEPLSHPTVDSLAELSRLSRSPPSDTTGASSTDSSTEPTEVCPSSKNFYPPLDAPPTPPPPPPSLHPPQPTEPTDLTSGMPIALDESLSQGVVGTDDLESEGARLGNVVALVLKPALLGFI